MTDSGRRTETPNRLLDGMMDQAPVMNRVFTSDTVVGDVPLRVESRVRGGSESDRLRDRRPRVYQRREPRCWLVGPQLGPATPQPCPRQNEKWA